MNIDLYGAYIGIGIYQTQLFFFFFGYGVVGLI